MATERAMLTWAVVRDGGRKAIGGGEERDATSTVVIRK